MEIQSTILSDSLFLEFGHPPNGERVLLKLFMMVAVIHRLKNGHLYLPLFLL